MIFNPRPKKNGVLPNVRLNLQLSIDKRSEKLGNLRVCEIPYKKEPRTRNACVHDTISSTGIKLCSHKPGIRWQIIA